MPTLGLSANQVLKRLQPSVALFQQRFSRLAVVAACIHDKPSFSKYTFISGSLVASAKRVHSAARFRHAGALFMAATF